MENKNKITVKQFKKFKQTGKKITMLTAYDYPTALILDQCGIDGILVGDSAGMVVMGADSTLTISLDNMLYHTKCVSNAVKRSLLIGDMPFLTYKIDKSEAVRNAGRFIQEAGSVAVKIEGGEEISDIIKAIVYADIPVMGHIGVTPQSVNILGGYFLRGKSKETADYLKRSAKVLEESGVFSIVLENIPGALAKEITSSVKVPTIGIGAGPDCDGQILVIHDILGFYKDFKPRFAKQYTDINKVITNAVLKYIKEVESGKFPGPKFYIK